MKKILSLLLALIMAASMIPAASAQSGDAEHTALADSVAAADYVQEAEVAVPELSTLDVGDNLFEENEPSQKPVTNPFYDVKESDFFYTPVLWAVENGITSGTSATTFAPNATCTRGQVVTFLWRANGSPKPKSLVNPFSDVKTTDYFYQAVLWAVENGITSGMGGGKFAPNDSCTRGQIVTFLYRADSVEANPNPPETPEEPGPDDTEIPEYILEMIDACAGDWAASPDDVVTLKEDGTLIYRGIEYTPEYDGDEDTLVAGIWDEGMAFVFFIGDGEMIAEHDGEMYYKGRTWGTVTLTVDNWFDYYELKTTTEFVNDPFGDYDHVGIEIYYVLKSEYAARLDTELKSTVDVKYGSDASLNEYIVDPVAQTVSLSETTGTHYVERLCSRKYNSVKHITLEGSYLDGTSGYAYFYTNTQLVNAQGTLYLVNN